MKLEFKKWIESTTTANVAGFARRVGELVRRQPFSHSKDKDKDKNEKRS